MHIWSIVVDGGDREFFLNWQAVVTWITCFKDDHNSESVVIESVYVNE